MNNFVAPRSRSENQHGVFLGSSRNRGWKEESMKSVMIQCLRGSWARGQRTSAAFHVGDQKNRCRVTVSKLGAEAFCHRDSVQRPLPELFLHSARRNWRRFAMADSTGRELNFGHTLVGAMLFRRLILDRCADAEAEKMVGVLLPPSVPAALLNLGISIAGRIPVNLNYTAPAGAISTAIERCRIKTIFTSEKLLSRLSVPTSTRARSWWCSTSSWA